MFYNNLTIFINYLYEIRIIIKKHTQKPKKKPTKTKKNIPVGFKRGRGIKRGLKGKK